MISPKDVVRHRFTAQQRQRLVARFHQSQLTRKEFAARHGVGFSTLSKWLQDEHRTGDPAVSFQEMVVPTAAMRWAVEVISPKGWTVRLNDSSAIPSLPKVLRALC
jgi:transposase-like protein